MGRVLAKVGAIRLRPGLSVQVIHTYIDVILKVVLGKATRRLFGLAYNMLSCLT